MLKTKKLASIGLAVFLGLSFSARFVHADTSTPAKGKGKTGAACKADADCDQSKQPQSCKDAKCQVAPLPPPVT